jgi:hypothetical protein
MFANEFMDSDKRVRGKCKEKYKLMSSGLLRCVVWWADTNTSKAVLPPSLELK